MRCPYCGHSGHLPGPCARCECGLWVGESPRPLQRIYVVPDFGDKVEATAKLEDDMAKLPLVDLLRVFAAAGRAILHRDTPRRLTEEELVRSLIEGHEEADRMGLK